MKLYLVRHGQTEWNSEKRFRGKIDLDLNEQGKKEALLLSKQFKHIKADLIYSSPLKRALQTSKFISDVCGGKILIDNDLRDMDFGNWEGKSLSEVEKTYMKLYQKWLISPHKVVIPNGESLSNVRDRVYCFLRKISKIGEEKVIIIVSHRVVLKLMVLLLLGLKEKEFFKINISNCSITLFQIINGKVRLELFNDTCHLKQVANNLVLEDW